MKKHLRAQKSLPRIICLVFIWSILVVPISPDRLKFSWQRTLWQDILQSGKYVCQGDPSSSCSDGILYGGWRLRSCNGRWKCHRQKQGTIFLAGPPLVKAATGEVIDAETLGGADLHCSVSGVTDHYAENDLHALHIARISFKVPRHQRPRSTPKSPLHTREPLYSASGYPESLEQIWKRCSICAKSFARIVDGSRFPKFKAKYGTTLITGTKSVFITTKPNVYL